MDIFETLSLQVAHGRAEPDVWVRRMVIYRQIAPEPVQIREIKLTKGVNIVWAEESDDERTPAEITGHSAGKTSFCRLYRYALGEKTFGTKNNMSLIQQAFPAGYLGAEIVVRGQVVVILRPIGNGIASYIKTGETIEALIDNRSESATQDEYPIKLGLNGLLDGLDAGAVLRTNKAIEWGHILAWCARDQETRFQNCYDWRSPRSESDWPSFRSSKADPLFVMRTVLGLFHAGELESEEELARLVQIKEDLDKQLIELRREPQFRINLYDKELRLRLRKLLPEVPEIEKLPLNNSDLFHDDLDRLTEKAKSLLEAEIKRAEDERSKLDDQIETLAGWIGVQKNRLKEMEALFNVDSSGQKEAEEGVAQRENERNKFTDAADKTCLLGGILYRDCPIVQDRQQSLRIAHSQDAQALEQAAANRVEAQRQLTEQKAAAQSRLTVLQDERKQLQEKRQPLNITVSDNQQTVRDLVASRSQLIEWTKKAETPGVYKEVDDCRKQIKNSEEKIQTLTNQLNDLLALHDSNRKLLSSIFSEAVHGVLPSGAYDGTVSLEGRELNFQITRGTAMSGEAVETLAVLLADLACMVYNSVSDRPRLPGFLLHDSPREADLSLRLYRHFVTLAASLQDHFGSAEGCPFQYIITTTTPPPAKLRNNKWVKLHLNAAVSNETLFRHNLASGGQTTSFSTGAN
jgi:hypothetical protein